MPEFTSRLSTALAGRYRIERRLGEGGMATVYLAEDLKHKRKVALKVLRPELAAVLGAERFVQEITTTANLQHPHILPLFDSGEADGFLYYVMPFIDGETLRDKLNRETQLGIEEAVKITTDVADALDYAHRNNVIHRDIKPENILLHEGRPMVADFGIALAVSAAAGGRMTETGLSLGTPHYMSPEQATAEKDLTNRSDIYSLGTVLYEMLTGEPPHTGASAQAIIMKIVAEDVQPVTELRKSVPSNVAAATAKSLEKLAADRFESAAKFAEALANPAFMLTTVGVQRKSYSVGDWRTRLAVPFALLTVVFAVAFVWALSRPPPSLPVDRFSVTLPAEEDPAGLGSMVVLSADGSVMVYRGPSESPFGQLWLRRRNQLQATPIQGSDAGTWPAISPDGGEVAWLKVTSVARGQLMVASLQGGAPSMVGDSIVPLGLDWDRNGALYFARAEGIVRMLPGGAEEVVTVVDRDAGTVRNGWIDVLPSAKGAVFTILKPGGRTIAAVRFDTGEITELTAGTFPRYSPTGHLVWARLDGTLLAAPFDPDELALTGPAVSVLGTVRISGSGGAHFGFSETGMLIYQTGGGSELVEPVWVNRSGVVQQIEPGWRIDPGLGSGLGLSPDGTRLAVGIQTGGGGRTGDVWVKQLDSGPLARLTFEGNRNIRMFWWQDGRSIGFVSNRSGQLALWRKRADGSGAAELLLERDHPIQEGFLTRDGNWLLYRVGSAAGNRDIYATRLDGDSVEIPLATTEFGERAAAVSPDGRWFAYVSNESGRDEVYVRPFPNAEDGRWQVSTAGGLEPVWAHSGRELFYRNSADEIVLVGLTKDPGFGVGQQRVLFSAAEYLSDFNHVLYDVSPDDQRFVMLRKVADDTDELIWVQNWFEELKEKLGRE